VGKIVKAQVLSVDLKARRIALSIKALTSKTPANKPQNNPTAKAAPAPAAPTMDNRLAALANRWKTR